ncbi:MAG TPA: hypothetical protein VGR78_06835, partial [Verrucomicrobiae bacterium]|nr:hypothetical protein [Verrucomicrobiae bacterium]
MKTIILMTALIIVWSIGAERVELGTPLTRVHAHNDYEHKRPLFDALAQGFCSVEADIYLKEGKLLVGHEESDLRPERTLEKLYLDPLRRLAEHNGGRIYPKGPTVILLIDIKTEAESTYAALRPVLQTYEVMLTRFTDGSIQTNAVMVVLSGNRPRETLLQEMTRLAAYDGRLSDLGKSLPMGFMPLVSDNFQARFPSASGGAVSEADAQKARAVI